jgi:hypothetical protein
MQVSVRAVLCWSEYYNGKWQPTKTSDVNKPTGLKEFNPAGTDAFDRSALHLSVSGGGNILKVDIFDQGFSWFILYNTHSLPVRKEDSGLSLTIPGGPSRVLGTSGDIFAITYGSGIWLAPTLSRQVLKNLISDRTVAPLHPLQNPWDAPFFYEDSCHVFYVTTAEPIVLIPKWNGYDVIRAVTIDKGKEIPQFVYKYNPIPDPIPDLYGPIIKGPFSGGDPAPMVRYVTEDAYIHRGIGSPGTVRFGDKEIGPAGSRIRTARIR